MEEVALKGILIKSWFKEKNQHFNLLYLDNLFESNLRAPLRNLSLIRTNF